MPKPETVSRAYFSNDVGASSSRNSENMPPWMFEDLIITKCKTESKL
jgi:hypothetical protein